MGDQLSVLEKINRQIQELDAEILLCDMEMFAAKESRDTSAYEKARRNKDYANEKLRIVMEMRRSASQASPNSTDSQDKP